MEHSKYRIEGFVDGNDIERGYDASSESDTLSAAKAKAKYMLGDDYRKRVEASSCLQYCRVMLVKGGDERDDDNVWDIYQKEVQRY